MLAWAVAHRPERELLEVVLQNVSLPDEAVEALASTLPEHLAELVVINQVRLLRRTSLLEALETNTGLNKDQRRRLRELSARRSASASSRSLRLRRLHPRRPKSCRKPEPEVIEETEEQADRAAPGGGREERQAEKISVVQRHLPDERRRRR